MSSDAPARPGQVTAAGWIVLLGGVFVVLSAFESIGSLRSLETRRSVEEFLAEPPGDGLGLGVEDVLGVMHASALVAGGCAAAMAVLGFFVLRRQKSARLAVSVLAVPLALSGMVLGGLLSFVIAAAVILLWMPPARDWFDGRTPRQPPRPPRGGHGPDRQDPPSQEPFRHGPPTGPDHGPDDGHRPDDRDREGARPYEGFGTTGGRVQELARPEQPAAQPGQQPAQQPAQHPDPAAYPHLHQPAPWQPQHGGWPAPAAQVRRPTAVVVACVVTWVTTGVVGLLTALSLVVLVASPDFLLEEVARQNPDLEEQGVTRSMLLGTTYVVGAVVVVWCVVAAVLAAFAFRGAGWARVALVVSALVAALVAMVASLGAPPMLLPMLAATVVAASLLRRESRAFSRSRS